MQADTFGSMTSKKRLFIIGFSGLKQMALKKLATVRTIVSTMKHENSDHVMSDFFLDVLRSDVMPKKRKVFKDSCAYCDEHLRLFQEIGLPWPPSDADIMADCGELVAEMVPRRREVVFLLHKMFGMANGVNFECIDANMSIGRLTQNGRNPWYPHKLQTLTGSCVMVCRFRKSPLGIPEFYVPTGYDAMALAGWHHTSYRCKGYDRSMLMQMAGNCYNGFALVPMITGIMCTLGLDADDYPVVFDSSDCESEAASSESPADDDTD